MLGIVRVAARTEREGQQLAEPVAHLEQMPALRALGCRNECLHATAIASHRAHEYRLVEGALPAPPRSAIERGAANHYLDTISYIRDATNHFVSVQRGPHR